jgi:hypothetical protein
MESHRPLQAVPDQQLLDRLDELTGNSRRTEADRVAHIAEVDARRLYARRACPSMFMYCTEVLHLSEPEAYLRITAARASLRHPVLLALLADGRLHLSGIALLARHLTAQNRDAILARACHRSKRAIEELIAELAPRPDAPTVLRKVPERRHAAEARSLTLVSPPPEVSARTSKLRPDRAPAGAPASSSRPVVEPLAPARYKFQFTAGTSLRDKLERLQALMRSQVPDGDLAAIIEEAVTERLERLEARRFAKTKRPRKGLAESDTSASTRHIPAAVKRLVAERDDMRCGYVDDRGRRCPQRHRLEFHHQFPFGFGGDHRPDGLRLMCAAHNQFIAEHDYGPDKMARHRRGAKHG